MWPFTAEGGEWADAGAQDRKDVVGAFADIDTIGESLSMARIPFAGSMAIPIDFTEEMFNYDAQHDHVQKNLS